MEEFKRIPFGGNPYADHLGEMKILRQSKTKLFKPMI